MIAIKKLETQFRKISTMLNQRLQGTLLKYMVKSPPTIDHFLDITSRSRSPTGDLPVPTTEELKNYSTTIDKTPEVEFEK